jgi:hypothetical protein
VISPTKQEDQQLMRIKDSSAVNSVKRKIYRDESFKKTRPESLTLAGSYFARIIKDYSTPIDYAGDHEVYVNEVHLPKRKAPFKWLFPGVAKVDLVPVSGPEKQATDQQNPSETVCMKKNGYLFEYAIGPGMIVPYKQIIGYLHPQDNSGGKAPDYMPQDPDESPGPVHDPDVKVWQALGLV